MPHKLKIYDPPDDDDDESDAEFWRVVALGFRVLLCGCGLVGLVAMAQLLAELWM